MELIFLIFVSPILLSEKFIFIFLICLATLFFVCTAVDIASVAIRFRRKNNDGKN